MRLRLLSFVLVAAALLSGAPAARAAVIAPHAAASGTNGIAYGADGDVWVVEEFANSVARFSPDGTLVTRYPVGADPTAITTGPNGSVWVAVTGADQLVWFDALSASPVAHVISTAGVSGCGPAAITDGQNGKMYFAQPSTSGACGATPNRLGSVAADGSGTPSQFGTATPEAYALAVFQGKLFAANSGAGTVLRFTLTGGLESTVQTPQNTSPDGLAVDATAGTVWATDSSLGVVSRFPASSASGTVATAVPVTGGTLSSAGGITQAADGSMFVAGYGSGTVVRFARDGTTRVFSLPTGAQPFGVAAGPAGSVYVSDQAHSTWYRIYDAAPSVTATSAAGSSVSTATVSGTIDTGGNDTTATIEYGTTTDYGQTAVLGSAAAGTAPVPLTGTLSGLAAATTYHARVRTTNADGSVASADVTFVTPATPSGPPNSGLPVAVAQPSATGTASLSTSRFKTTGKKAGTTLTVTVSGAPAVVKATIALQAKGVKTSSGKKPAACVAPPKKKVRGQPSCTRLLPKGTITLGSLAIGTTRLPFTGTIGKKRLAPGTYTMVLTIGRSTKTLTFTVKR